MSHLLKNLTKVLIFCTLLFLPSFYVYGADVSAPSKNNSYTLTIQNFGTVDLKGVRVTPSIGINPKGLVVLSGVEPSSANIAVGGSKKFLIKFNVKCPPEKVDEVKQCLFKFKITSADSQPLITDGPSSVSEGNVYAKGSFAISIKLSGCSSCTDYVVKPAKLNACQKCENGSIVRIDVPKDTRCRDYYCDPSVGIRSVRKPGCDHPDDNESEDTISDDSSAGTSISADSEISVLTSGFFTSLLKFAGDNNESINPVEPVLSDELLKNKKVLIIPSGGLYGLDNSPSIRNSLETFVAEGGTLVVFSQQYGKEYEAIPGGLKGYGWDQDMSCQFRSIYLDTFHQVLSSMKQKISDSVVDGYYTKWPEDSKVLLRRTKNGMPCMVYYKYGEGQVLATTIYEDWSYKNGQSTQDGRKIMMDILRWAKSPERISDFSPGDDINLPFTLENYTNDKTEQYRINIYKPNNELFKGVAGNLELAAEERKELNLALKNIEGELGIWYTEYQLIDSSGETVQEAKRGVSFAVNIPPEGEGEKDISFGVTSDKENYVYGDDGNFKISIWNNSSVDKTITAIYAFPHNFWQTNDPKYGAGTTSPGQNCPLKHVFNIPANENREYTFSVPLISYDRLWVNFYDENKRISQLSRGFNVFHPSLKINLSTDKRVYKNDDVVTINALAYDHGLSDYEIDLDIKITDPEGNTLFKEKMSALVGVQLWKKNFSYELLKSAKPGVYSITLAGVNKKTGEELSRRNCKFKVLEPLYKIIPEVRDTFNKGANKLNWHINNGGSKGYNSGTLEYSIYSNGEKICSKVIEYNFDGNNGGDIEDSFDLPFLSLNGYWVKYAVKTNGKVFNGSRFINCRGVLRTRIDKNVFRQREYPVFSLDFLNEGDVSFEELDLEIALPDDKKIKKKISLEAGKTYKDSISFQIPTDFSPGQYCFNAKVSGFKEKILEKRCFSLAPPKFEVGFLKNEIELDEKIKISLVNVGGVDSDIEYIFALYDSKENKVFESTGNKKLKIDISDILMFLPPENLLEGFYLGELKLIDKKYKLHRIFNKRLKINGSIASIEVATDKNIYLSSDLKKAKVSLNLKKGALGNGFLHLKAINESLQGGSIRWRYNAGYSSENKLTIGKDGSIYFRSRFEGDDRSFLCALSKDGVEKWRYPLDSSLTNCRPVIDRDNTIYMTSRKAVHAISPEGTLKWKYEDIDGGFEVYTGNGSQCVSFDENTIYVCASEYGEMFKLVALNKDGTLKWSTKGNNDIHLNFSFPSIVHEDKIYLISRSGDLFCIDTDGNVEWRYELDIDFEIETLAGLVDLTMPVDSKGNIYFAGSGELHCINPDGTNKWIYNLGGNAGWPVIQNDRCYLYGKDSDHKINLFAVTSSGELEWKSIIGTKSNSSYNFPVPPVLRADGSILSSSFENNKGVISIFNTDGSIKRTKTINSYFPRLPKVSSTGDIYVAASYRSDDLKNSMAHSRIYCLGSDLVTKWVEDIDEYFIRIELNSDGELFAVIGYDVCGLGGIDAWEKLIPIDFTGLKAGASKRIEAEMDTLKNEGIYRLTGSFKNERDELISKDFKSFVVDDKHLSFLIETDKDFYKPGEKISVSGVVLNRKDEKLTSINLNFKTSDSIEIYNETFDLEGFGEKKFIFELTAPEKIVELKGFLNSVVKSFKINIDKPTIEYEYSPLQTGRGNTEFRLKLKNPSKVNARLDVKILDEVYNIIIPPENYMELSKTLNVNSNQDIPVKITGDVKEEFSCRVELCEKIEIVFQKQQLHSQGTVIIPFKAENNGCTDTETEILFNVNGVSIVKKVFVPSGSSSYGFLSLTLGPGSHSITFNTPYESGSFDVDVAKNRDMEINLDVKKPGKPKLLIVKKGIDSYRLERMLEYEKINAEIKDLSNVSWNGEELTTQNYDVVVFIGGQDFSKSISLKARESISKFIKSGGGIVSTESPDFEGKWDYSYLNSLAMFDEESYLKVRVQETVKFDSSHEISKDFTGDLMVPEMIGNSGDIKDGAIIIASGLTIKNLLVVQEKGLGRIAQFATPLETRERSLVEDERLTTLFLRTITWASGKSTQGESFLNYEIKNNGLENFNGNLKVESDFFITSSEFLLDSMSSRTDSMPLDLKELEPGIYPVSVSMSEGGVKVKEVFKNIEIKGAEFSIERIYDDSVFQPGKEAEIKFKVINKGDVRGRAELAVSILDIIQDQSVYDINAGEEKELSYKFMLHDDIPMQEYFASIQLNGKTFKIPFYVDGVRIRARASFDKDCYEIGEEALLNLTIYNHGSLNPDMFVRVIHGMSDIVSEFTLDRKNELKFKIPVKEETYDNITYGIYMKSGRSVLLNTIRLRKFGGDLTIYPEHEEYSPGQTILLNVVTDKKGTLALSGPNNSFETYEISGNTVVKFVLPVGIAAGKCCINYAMGDIKGSTCFRTSGITAIAKNVKLDKEVYEPKDKIETELIFNSKYFFAGILKGWIYKPDGNYTDLFEVPVEIKPGDNIIKLSSSEFSTDKSGFHMVVYTLYENGSMTVIVEGAEGFDVKPAALTNLGTGVDPHSEEELIDVSAELYACEKFIGDLEFYVNEKVIHKCSVDFIKSETVSFSIDPMLSGNYQIVGKLLKNNNVLSTKKSDFKVRDRKPPQKPQGLEYTSDGRVLTLRWGKNSDDTIGYRVYRNGELLNEIPVFEPLYKDSELLSNTAYSYQVSAVDSEGNESDLSDPIFYNMDSLPPVILMNPPNSIFSLNPVEMTYEAKDNIDNDPVVSANYPSPTFFYKTGTYNIFAEAVDSSGNKSSKSLKIGIEIKGDSDNDGMLDEWEQEHFKTLDMDGTGDFDNDGITDLDEYLNGSDPCKTNAPGVPEILKPLNKSEQLNRIPEFRIKNSIDPDGDAIKYYFENYADISMQELVESRAFEPSEGAETVWISSKLSDNQWYYWRVRASDGKGFSPWGYGSFFVNTENDAPEDFEISHPSEGSETDTKRPVLQITNSSDIDEDEIFYLFEIYEDILMNSLVTVSEMITPGDNGSTSWKVDSLLKENVWYYWRVKAIDEHGAETVSKLSSFFVKMENEAPTKPIIKNPLPGEEIIKKEVDLTIENSVDPDGDSLEYFFQLDIQNTFDSEKLIESGLIDEISPATYWNVSHLSDNTKYFWRVKSSDRTAESQWVTGDFFVNTVNDSPSVPAIKNPGNNSWVDTLTPSLEVQNSIDLDNDDIFYKFELYSDLGLNDLITSEYSGSPTMTVQEELEDNKRYYWRVKAIDEHGAESIWTETICFYTDSNGVNDAPEIEILEPSENQYVKDGVIIIRWKDSDPDGNGIISLYYLAEQDGAVDKKLIIENLYEDPDDESDSYTWDLKGVSEGKYRILAEITDGHTLVSSTSTGVVTIDRTVPEIEITPGQGEYEEEQTITMKTDKESVVYYTLDGSYPDYTKKIYKEPFIIKETCHLKAMAQDQAGNKSPLYNYEYKIINGESSPGDLDNDGDVDKQDRTIIRKALFSTNGCEDFIEKADYNEDGWITIRDYIIWYDYFIDYILKKNIPYHKGDLDLDGDVDSEDEELLDNSMWSFSNSNRYIPEADFNKDGWISLRDKARWKIYYRTYNRD